MEPNQPEESKKPTAAPKKAAKLPSKSISFSGQPGGAKGGKQGNKVNINKSKKGGVNLMKKLSGM